ncbi:hypothetical protein M231_03859 [Tremella mesenterica]|uniref:Uncharacterized protein n=1 Tax=Tremella mesenterica TaxID=5217 RepID=A0A4Q1BMF9_TREME|nr:hypothetical protein M231_03859 [Tremella mesenterica]
MSNFSLDGSLDLSNVDWENLLAMLNRSQNNDRMENGFTIETNNNTLVHQAPPVNEDDGFDIDSWINSDLLSDNSSVIANHSCSLVEVISVASTTPTPASAPSELDRHLSATTVWRHNQMDKICRLGITRARKCRNCLKHPGRSCIQHGRNTACYHCVRGGLKCDLIDEYDGDDEKEEHHHHRPRDPSPAPDYLYAGSTTSSTSSQFDPFAVKSPQYSPNSPPLKPECHCHSRSPTPKPIQPSGPSMLQMSEHLSHLQDWDKVLTHKENWDRLMRQQLIGQVRTMMNLDKRCW